VSIKEFRNARLVEIRGSNSRAALRMTACGARRINLEFERFQGNLLRGHQKFAGKRELRGTAAKRFLGAKPHEVGIIVFLRNVRQDEVAGPTVETFGIAKKLAHGAIRKMAGAGKHTLFDDPGIRPNLQHIEIVVRFQNQAIGRAQVYLYQFRHVAEVGADRDLRAVGTKRESDGVGSIVRDREGMNIDVTDRKTLASFNGFDAT